MTWTAYKPLIVHMYDVCLSCDNEVVVLIKIVEKNEMLLFDKDVAENQHTAKVQTQKGIRGTVLTVQFLPSGEHKNYDHDFNFKFYKY